MKEKIEISELVRRFVGFLGNYSTQKELGILGIDTHSDTHVHAFHAYYRPLMGVLWLQAVEYHFPQHVDAIREHFLEQVKRGLAHPLSDAEHTSFAKKVAYFSKLTRRDNGMFIVSMDCLDQLAPDSANRGDRVKQLTIHMLELFQTLLHTLEGFQIVADGQAQPALPPTRARTLRAVANPDSPFMNDGAVAPQDDVFNNRNSPFYLGEDEDLPPEAEYVLPTPDEPDKEDPYQIRIRQQDTGDQADLSEDFVQDAPDRKSNEFLNQQEENIVDLDDFKLLLNDERRQEARVPSQGMQAMVEGKLREFPVNDISVSGIGIDHQGWQFKVDEVICFDLYYGYKLVLKNVKARVVRRDDKRVGCILTNVPPEKTGLICSKLSNRLKKQQS